MWSVIVDQNEKASSSSLSDIFYIFCYCNVGVRVYRALALHFGDRVCYKDKIYNFPRAGWI